MVNYIIQSIIVAIINGESVASFSLILLMFKIYSSGTAISTSNTHTHTYTYLILVLNSDLVHVNDMRMHRWTGEGLGCNTHAHLAGVGLKE